MRQSQRQSPASCQLCRTKKLKCDRQRPCSNCSARGVTCSFLQPRPGRQIGDGHDGTSTGEILARLERVEQDVAFLKAERLPSLSSLPQQTASATQPTLSTDSSARRNGEEHHKDYMSFEPLGMDDRSLVFRKEPQLTVSAAEDYIDARPLVSAYDHVLSSIILPSEAHAILMFNTFIKGVGHHPHVIHGPTVRTLLTRVYSSLPCGQYPNPGHIALLLVIFASTAYSWRLSCERQHLFLSSEDCLEAARTWGISAVDILELSRRVTARSLEDLQAMIIGASTFQYAEGHSRHASFLQTSALALARDLGLHKVDFAVRARALASPGAAVEYEIKRRIWWYLAARDWLLAFDWGRQDGTYNIQPRHMRVDYPQNVDDEDLPVDRSASSTNLSVPTSMSFHLQHIRLADICRRITDRLPPFLSGIQETDYEAILTLDAEFQKFLDELPAFFHLELQPDSCSHPSNNFHQHHHIACQRSLLHADVHARRIKLHHPFLWREVSARYAHSRDVCLLSARTILEAGRLGVSEGTTSCFGTTLAAILPHTFVAAMALVHDVCYSREQYASDNELRVRHEAAITEARTTIERAARYSLRGKKFLHSLDGVLSKNKIFGSTEESESGAGYISAQIIPPGRVHSGDGTPILPLPSAVENKDADGDTIPEGNGNEFEIASWQALFEDLDMWNSGFQ